MSPLKSPVVLVTGAAGLGIGTSTCIRFAQEGYNVVATDIQDDLSDESESIKSIKKHLKGDAQCLVLKMDVCSSESVNEGVEAAMTQFGRIDVVVNNAAASFGTDIMKLDEATWDANVNLALKSVYLVCRAVLPIMLSSPSGGRIVNVSSVNGQTGLGEEAYSAAKAGVINLTQNLAVKYGPQGIRVNCVVPGTIETNLWKERIDKDPNVLQNLKKYYPLGRIGRGEDVANAIWFLASEQSSWITGVCLNVDGGLMAGNSGLQRDLVP